MLKLLKSDFYKLSKTKSFFICLLLIISLAVMYVCINHFTYDAAVQGPHPGASLYLAESFSANSLIFSSIVVSLFVACEFGFGTIKNTASKGFGRSSIYISKLIVACVIAVSYLLAFSAASTITGTVLWGFGPVDGAYWAQTAQIAGLEVLLTMAFTSVFVFFSTLIRQSGGAIAVNICLISFFSSMVMMGEMLLNFLFKTEWNLYQFLLSSNMSVVSKGGLTEEVIVRALLVGVLYFAVSTALGVWIFHKRDIK